VTGFEVAYRFYSTLIAIRMFCLNTVGNLECRKNVWNAHRMQSEFLECTWNI